MRMIAGPAHAVRAAAPDIAHAIGAVAGDALVCVSIADDGDVLARFIDKISEAFALRAQLQRDTGAEIKLRIV